MKDPRTALLLEAALSKCFVVVGSIVEVLGSKH